MMLRTALACDKPAPIRGTAKARMGVGFCVRETATLQAIERGSWKGSMIGTSEARERDIGEARFAPRV